VNLYRRVKAALGLGSREGASPPPWEARTEEEALAKIVLWAIAHPEKIEPYPHDEPMTSTHKSGRPKRGL
jgi:hypothetical protein